MTTECGLGAADETIADPETPVRVPAESLDACQAELADVKDRLLRALADQENSRRRAEREREDAVRFAAAQLVTDLLPTADSLSRALENAPAGDDPLQGQGLLAGVAATHIGRLRSRFARRNSPNPVERDRGFESRLLRRRVTPRGGSSRSRFSPRARKGSRRRLLSRRPCGRRDLRPMPGR